MADGVLLVVGQFGVGEPLRVGAGGAVGQAHRVGHEQRIVTKAVCAPALKDHPARALAHDHQIPPVGHPQADRRHKAGGPLPIGHIRQSGQQLVVVGLIVPVAAAVPGAVDAGRAVQRVHLQADADGPAGLGRPVAHPIGDDLAVDQHRLDQREHHRQRQRDGEHHQHIARRGKPPPHQGGQKRAQEQGHDRQNRKVVQEGSHISRLTS